MTELLAGTKKGLFVLEGRPGGSFEVGLRAFDGDPVDFAIRDPRSGRVIVATGHPVYGPKIFYTDDPGGEWTQATGVELPEESGQALVRLWVIVPGEAPGLLYAGGDPGVLFESHDGGESWKLNQALWQEPTRPQWQPGGGGLCLHSIATWPGDPQRLAIAVSAAGVWLSDDGGQSWRRGNQGLLARYLPEEVREASNQLCVHHVERSPSSPERMFMQFHGGVYRSDDAGESWSDIAEGLPSDFGFPLTVDPADPDSAYVIPLKADTDRVTAEGRVLVWQTRDAGANWKPCGDGLPQRDAYLTILRQAFTQAGEGESLELYFGTTSGEVFGSGDAGTSWFSAARRLPPIYSLIASS